MDSHALFEMLVEKLNARVDRSGEAHCDCPKCGKEVKLGSTHFSFSERGAHCFVCDYSAGIAGLAALVGVIQNDPHYEYKPPRPKPKPRVRKTLSQDVLRTMLNNYTRETERLTQSWHEYKPVPQEVIAFYRLGLGSFPQYTSRCNHERLQVPYIRNDGQIMGFRGRQIDCDCGKWLAPSGTGKFLYNAGRFYDDGGIALDDRNCKGEQLYIVENPIDALMFEFVSKTLWGEPIVAVSTQGVTMWEDEWTEAIRKAGFASVTVCYDNDAPGNGGGKAGRALWRKEHKGVPPPVNGLRLVNRLLKGGIRQSYLYDWEDAPLKMDMGDLLDEEMRVIA